MNSGIVGLVALRADVAIHLVAPRVVHGFELGDFVRVLALADRRMVARDLLDAVAPDLVQPRVTDVPDDRARLLQRRRP